MRRSTSVYSDYRKLLLPYGKWTCADGREVLFNRSYMPIWERHHGVTRPILQSERVKFVHQKHFYTESSSPKGLVKRLEKVLVDFGAA